MANLNNPETKLVYVLQESEIGKDMASLAIQLSQFFGPQIEYLPVGSPELDDFARAEGLFESHQPELCTAAEYAEYVHYLLGEERRAA